MKFGTVLLVFASCILGGACGELPSDAEESEFAVSWDGWTGMVRDEEPAGAICLDGYTLRGTRCYGRYCDDMQISACSLNYGITDGVWGPIQTAPDGFWSAWISEEFAPKTPYQHNGHTVVGNWVACESSSAGIILPNTKVIDGLRASGNYSDDISVHCATLQGGHRLDPASCKWTGEFSEEHGCDGSQTPGPCYIDGDFAVAVRCTGSNCDNMSYLGCKMVR